jgi:NADPH-dependent glutamate synthase beta subunit-like oxidoreductase
MAKVQIPHPVDISLSPLSLINHRAYLIPYRSQTSHAAAKKAALPIRFVIVGGGAAGLACAVALRRVGHHVILLEKDSNFVGVSIVTPRFPSCLLP